MGCGDANPALETPTRRLTARPVTSSRMVDALLALPANIAATKLRLRLAVGDTPSTGTGCYDGATYSAIVSGMMAVVGAHGEVAERVNLACDGAMVDHLVTLPAASPRWLVVHVEGATPLPYYSPVPGLPPVNIDEVEFL